MAPQDIPNTDPDTVPEEELDLRKLVRKCFEHDEASRIYNEKRRANMTPEQIAAEEKEEREQPVDLALMRRLKKLGEANASVSPWLEQLCCRLGGAKPARKS